MTLVSGGGNQHNALACMKTLVPPGFVVESAADDQYGVLLRVRSARASSSCPKCGMPSVRIHSRYLRRLADLPLSGLGVRLVLLARRFRCEDAVCVSEVPTPLL